MPTDLDDLYPPVEYPPGDYEPEWLTGVPAEDELVVALKCPYQTSYGFWGQAPTYCGQPRSVHSGDEPYCLPHAAQIRHDRGYGGYVG
jgi:hypothetical protein